MRVEENHERASGLKAWQKWSFPSGPLSPDSSAPGGWMPVRKRRRISRFSLASGQIVAHARELGQRPGADSDAGA
jgi:hypothetical protein